jgi:hypothetical protein
MSEKPETWADVDQFYRNIADGFMKQAEEFKQKASSIDPSNSKDARLQNNYYKMASKYVVQAKGFYGLADKARYNYWVDEAKEALAELELGSSNRYASKSYHPD